MKTISACAVGLVVVQRICHSISMDASVPNLCTADLDVYINFRQFCGRFFSRLVRCIGGDRRGFLSSLLIEMDAMAWLVLKHANAPWNPELNPPFVAAMRNDTADCLRRHKLLYMKSLWRPGHVPMYEFLSTYGDTLRNS